MWDNADQLAGQVATTLNTAIKRYPALGWIRGDQQANSEILREINILRKENEALKEKIADFKPFVPISNLADLEDTYTVKYTYRTGPNMQRREGAREFSWGEILRIIGGNFRTLRNSSGAGALDHHLKRINGAYNLDISNATYVEILTQFELTALMSGKPYNIQGGGSSIFYQLTENGLQEYLTRMAITKNDKNA